MSSATNISELSDKEKQNAIEKYRIIEPFLNTSKSLTKISQESHTSLRTLQYWVKKYGMAQKWGVLVYTLRVQICRFQAYFGLNLIFNRW